MNITEFLLARITEDETAAEAAGSFTPWTDTFQRDNYGHLTIQPSRIEHESEAKRQIVESCRRDYEDAQASGDDTTSLAEEVLHQLARPYSGHPDYLAEWRR